MGSELAECGRLCQLAREVLGADLEPLCTGDAVPVWDPALVQPALLVVCVAAALARLRYASPDAVLGHSFGEYAALTATGALSAADGLRLAAARARAMAALADGTTGMMAVLGLPPDTVREVCGQMVSEGGTLWVANVNSPSQTVLSGSLVSLRRAGDLCRERGAIRTRSLRVAYAAHSPVMAGARAEVRAALDAVSIKRPKAPLYSAVTGESTREPRRIRQLLDVGMTEPVCFSAAVRAAAADGHREFLELGPGSPPRLLGLIRETLGADGVRLALVSSDTEAADPQPFKAAEADSAEKTTAEVEHGA